MDDKQTRLATARSILARAVIGMTLTALCAETFAAEADEETPSVYDRIWGYAILYKDDSNPVIEDFALVGRVQVDAAFFDADQGNYERLVWRRFRFGFKSTVFRNVVAHAEVDFDWNDFDADHVEDSYERITDAYLGWSSPGEGVTVEAGKQSAPFTLDGATSSKKLITLERSIVAGNLWFPTEYFTGLAGMGMQGDCSYHVGAYSASGDEEFGSFDSGYFALASLGREVGMSIGPDTMSVRLDYVYNDPDYSGTVGTRDLRHVLSIVTKIEGERAGVWSDLSFGDGIGEQSDLWGLQVMPLYNFTKRWQAVFRYALVQSSGENGVRLARYPARVESGRADEVHEFFLGLNWYLYGHKLKWQNGVVYDYSRDAAGDGGAYDGWGFTSGIRLSW